MRKILGLLFIGALFLVLAWYFGFFDSEEDRIQKLLNEVETQLSLPADQNPIAFASQLKSLEAYFSPDVQLLFKMRNHPQIELKSWNDMKAKMLQGRGFLKYLSVEFKDEEIQVDGETAGVSLSLVVDGQLQNAQESFTEASEVRIELQKDAEGDWRIQSLENIEAVRFR